VYDEKPVSRKPNMPVIGEGVSVNTWRPLMPEAAHVSSIEGPQLGTPTANTMNTTNANA
jgi:hypothetical protein